MTGLNPLALRILGGAIALLLLVALVVDRNQWKARAGDRAAQIEVICTATRSAAVNPKLDCKRVPAQVAELGASIAALKRSLANQNAALDRLAAAGAEQRKASAVAQERAQARASTAEGTRAALEASARSGGAQRAPCEVSRAVKDAWQ